MHLRRVSTDKYVLDKVSPSIEMCFQTIHRAGLRVEFEKTRETYAQGQCQQKVQQFVGSKVEKKENPKAVDKGPKVDSLESQISKPKQKKKKPVAKVTRFKPAPTKVKEPDEDQVSQSVHKDRMTNGQCIKCGKKGHIQSDCTKGWKPSVT